MSDRGKWLIDLERKPVGALPDGLVLVDGYAAQGRPPEEVAIMEKAKSYNAQYVFFEAGQNGRPSTAQAFVFVSDGRDDDQQFANLHKRLWSWGGVPLVYRKTPGLVQLFRCAHQPDFVSATGQIVCKPVKTLAIAASISNDDAWWDSAQLRNGTLWDDPAVCKMMMSASKSAHKHLIDAVKQLNRDLNEEGILKSRLRRRLLILSLLIAYLEERGVFPPDYFGQFLKNATKFFQVLANGKALIALLSDLEERFNGHVFTLDDADRTSLRTSTQLARFAKLVEAHEEINGQLTLWELYSFRDLPVELISHIYQLFVTDSDVSVYTPPFLVRLTLEEALSWDRLDRLHERNEVILDPACGSGVFLVEAYKRLVLHWRSRNQWKRPRTADLKKLLKKVHGIDLEQGAVELAAFSLCLALCDALEPEEIRSSIKLFPLLQGKTLHNSCFFEAKTRRLVKEPVGVVLGNPPFASKLTTEGAKESYAAYQRTHGVLPDRQLAYLFLHEAMEMVAEGGILSMLQPYGFLYNQQSDEFRRDFFERWDVREVLDFVSVRGLFQKGGADTKVIVAVVEASPPKEKRKLLHAVFRRSGRADAEQGFDIDYYDLHWLTRDLLLNNDGVWRANLFGGGRVLTLLDRLKSFRTLRTYATERGWDFGEGFIEGQRGVSNPAEHLIGKPLLPSEALSANKIDESQIATVRKQPIEGPRSSKRFTPPMLLIREQMELPHAVWTKGYLTYKNQIVGFAAPKSHEQQLRAIDKWLTAEAPALKAFVAGVSAKVFTQKATTLTAADILALPYPEAGTLDLSDNETIVASDMIDYQRDLIRLGEDSRAMMNSGLEVLPEFASVFMGQINSVYKRKPIHALPAQTWPGVICQPFVFGNGGIDWSGADGLQGRLNALLLERNETLHVTRIARIYDKQFVFLLKPDRLRYWLRSVALRDSDETLADLRAQGF
ncbi:N-6 DNA methylase [Bradyrhizobium sp. UFLA01-814]|uniref:HsdM family class I SAM-dependent methyltransferase n=1 Tax=Bradyrhizobium sp. UFLA01-814 TaxID=3023480 RepID=UPI00398A8BE0